MSSTRWITVVALVVLAVPVAAQEHQAPIVLRIPASAWALGMGNAGVALRTTSDVLFYNPASLTLSGGASVSVQRWGSAATAASLSHSVISSGWGIGIGAQFLDYGADADGFTIPAQLTTRGPLLGSSVAGTIGLAREYKRLRIGVAAKYVVERLPGDRDGFALVDVGVGRYVGNFAFALAVQNLGTDRRLGLTPYKPPFHAALGASLRPQTIGTFFDLGATAQVQVDRDGEFDVAGGGELLWVPLDGWSIALRAGLRTTDRLGDEGARPYTAGLGISLDRFSLDYGMAPYRGGTITHRIGLRMR